MTFKLPSLTRETTNTTGTGDRLLAGAVTGYVAVSAGLSDQDTAWATIKNGTDFEIGLYTYNSGANSLTPTDIYRSTNANAAVNWGAGTKDVQIDLPGPSDIAPGDRPLFLSLMGAPGGGGGFVNQFRNAAMDVWQRGTVIPVSTAGGYTADGHIVLPSSQSVTVNRVAGRLLTQYGLEIVGNASVTDAIWRQRIESNMAARLTSQPVTVSGQIQNNTGSSITPVLSIGHPSSVDTYSAVGSASLTNEVNAVNLETCPNGATTQFAYTFDCSSSAANGLEVNIDFGNNFSTNGKNVVLYELDIRATAGPAGLNSNLPTPELRPLAAEFDLCRRYFRSTFGNAVTPAQNAGFTGAISYRVQNESGGQVDGVSWFGPPMRTTPNFIFYNPAANNANWRNFTIGADSGPAVVFEAGQDGFFVYNTQLSADAGFIAIHATASAEL